MTSRYIPAVFYDPATKQTSATRVRLPSTAQSKSQSAIIRCCDISWDEGCTMWAHEDPVTSVWLVFRCNGRAARVLLKKLPTQEAAEMWMVHCG